MKLEIGTYYNYKGARVKLTSVGILDGDIHICVIHDNKTKSIDGEDLTSSSFRAWSYMDGIADAYNEGALLEEKVDEWKEIDLFSYDSTYSEDNIRIKGDITYSQWLAHNDVIKAFWKGSKIEYLLDEVWYETSAPSWNISNSYRLKETEVYLFLVHEEGSSVYMPVYTDDIDYKTKMEARGAKVFSTGKTIVLEN